jgi:hypothetical protein
MKPAWASKRATRRRRLGAVAAVVLAASVAAAQTPAPRTPAAQTPSVQTRTYRAPRTADGQPDLQGFWTNSTYTPLERPDGVTKPFYTPAEAEAAIKLAVQRESAQTEPGTTADVHYDFSQFGLDRSQSLYVRSLRTSLIVDPADGKIPPLTGQGKRRTAQRAEEQKKLGGRWDSAESNQLDDRCLIMAGAGPPMMDAGYNSNYHIVQSPGVVMILTEMIHDVRIIALDSSTRSGSPPASSTGDGRMLVDPKIRQWMGVSRGRWDGDTLVVETTNFNAKNPFRGSDENLKVIERFTRVSDDTIEYRFTIDDPTMWTRPWSAESAMKKTVGPIFEHACHEGNFGLYNTLVGARLEEKNAAEDALKKGAK